MNVIFDVPYILLKRLKHTGFTLQWNNAWMFQMMWLWWFVDVSKNRALSVASMFFLHLCDSHCDVKCSNKTLIQQSVAQWVCEFLICKNKY